MTREKIIELIETHKELKSKYRKLLEKSKRKRLEFMQKICVASWVLMAVVILSDIILAAFDKMPIPSTTQYLIGFVSTFINGGYVTQNIIRNCSLNRNGMRIPPEGGKHYLTKPNNDEEVEG